MPNLKDYVWMRQQWPRFRHVLVGTHTAVLILCASGLLLLHEDPQAWIYVRLALMVLCPLLAGLLLASTAVAMWLLYKARREIREPWPAGRRRPTGGGSHASGERQEEGASPRVTARFRYLPGARRVDRGRRRRLSFSFLSFAATPSISSTYMPLLRAPAPPR